ncbi:MAG: hypothetical protein Q9168_002294 [Polycauliona sp. 1 TL-2023]
MAFRAPTDNAGIPSSEALREQGNKLYKEGKVKEGLHTIRHSFACSSFDIAIESYSRAATSAPTDPRPWSNLSAAHFELGEYGECIKDVSTALGIPSKDNSEVRKKLCPRLIKSYLHIKDVLAAEASCAYLQDHPEGPRLRAACPAGTLALKDPASATQKLICDVPRYLCTLDDSPEYYPIGHDKACSQINDNMMQRSVKEPISLFFGGIGDARNLFATLIEIVRLETIDSRPAKRKYHATINDLKAPTLARNLIMFYLLDDLAQFKAADAARRFEQLTVIFYLFTASIMPPFVAGKIRQAVSRAEQALLSSTDLLPWAHVDQSSRDAVLQSLKFWQQDLKQSYPAQTLVEMSTEYFKEVVAKFSRQTGRAKHPVGCEVEIESFRITGALRVNTSAYAVDEDCRAIFRRQW